MANADTSVSRFFFSGSVSEAIVKAKLEHKRLVIFVSGDDEESRRMELTTWPEAAAAGALNVMLIYRMQEGSSAAAHFNAFCKINRAPTVAVIDPNGDRVFWHEGFISSEDLVTGISHGALKAELAKTMAIMLHSSSVARAPIIPMHGQNNVEFQTREGATGQGQQAVRSTAAMEDRSPQTAAESSGGTVERTAEAVSRIERELLEDSELEAIEESPSRSRGETAERSVGGQHAHQEPAVRTSGISEQRLEEAFAESNVKLVAPGSNKSEGTVEKRKRAGPSGGTREAPSEPSAQDSVPSPSPAPPRTYSAAKKSLPKQAPNVPPQVVMPQVAVIQFRLTDGESMRGEFDVNAPLWDARSWLDANRKDSGSLYDLAIPFPKRILTHSDLDKSFAELQLFPRASLLLIPKKRSQAPAHNVSNGASGASGEQPGFVGGVTRAVGGVLGYLNPMAYFGGGAQAETTTQPAGQRPWEYGPNPQLERAFRDGGAGAVPSQDAPVRDANTDTGGRFATLGSSEPGGSGQQNTGGPGSSDQTRKRGAGARGNIHGLDHSSEAQTDPNRNNFWNGNSTQFGSNDDKNQ